MEIVFTDKQLQGMQAECDAYNVANETALTVEQFVQLLATARATDNLRRFGTVNPYVFVERFTPEEYSAIRATALTNVNVAALLTRLAEVKEVRLYSEEVAMGLALLESLGIIVPGRAAEISAV